MQTNFSLAQLADPDTAETEKILRTCVHCGFCTATCPTYVLLGDELDSPRGRIYLVKDMLEQGRPATEEVVTHIDRCLSCLSCMTTCPSGVNYMHLVDHARRHIEETYRRPFADRAIRWLLATLLPRPGLFRLALFGASLARPFARILPARLATLLRLAPADLPSPSRSDLPQTFPAQGTRRKRVALLTGCVQSVIAPRINEATIRLLTRHGCEVVVSEGAGCCGALVHHLGRDALDFARRNIDAWDRDGIDAVVVNASGCGTTVKDYGFMLREDAAYAEKAKRISGLTRDISELMVEVGLEVSSFPPPPPSSPPGLTRESRADAPFGEAMLRLPAAEALLPREGGKSGHDGEMKGEERSVRVAYHAACSLQHGQKIKSQPMALLAAAGFHVSEPSESHLCCGSAGTYNMLQPEIATRLRDRKLSNINCLKPDVIATGNIGCMTQLAGGTEIPVVHTVELLDWATGGPRPPSL